MGLNTQCLKIKEKSLTWWVFEKPVACNQTVLPDELIQIRQKIAEISKPKNSNTTFWVIFKHCATRNDQNLSSQRNWVERSSSFTVLWNGPKNVALRFSSFGSLKFSG